MIKHSKMSRRWFLRGMGGVTLGLPLLDASHATGQDPAALKFALFVVGANGVAMADSSREGEVEMFWPTATGPLTTESLRAEDTQYSRTLGLLADYAPRLLLVRGVDQPYGSAGCDHQSGDNMCLTAAKISGGGNSSLAMGESIDNRIARERNPSGREPVTLRAGWRPNDATGYDNPGFISYVGDRQPRAAEPSPLRAYQRMVGMGSTSEPDISKQRASINDLLRSQINDLMASPALSSDDRQRLQQHFDTIHDIEVATTVAVLEQELQDEMAAVDNDMLGMDNHPQLIRL